MIADESVWVRPAEPISLSQQHSTGNQCVTGNQWYQHQEVTHTEVSGIVILTLTLILTQNHMCKLGPPHPHNCTPINNRESNVIVVVVPRQQQNMKKTDNTNTSPNANLYQRHQFCRS